MFGLKLKFFFYFFPLGPPLGDLKRILTKNVITSILPSGEPLERLSGPKGPINC